MDPIRAAVYVRVSTADQVDNTSLDEQRRSCRAAIEAKGDAWTFAGEYADEGRSGTDSERPEWRRLLADVESGKVTAVVVAKLDRFSRNASDAIRETDRIDQLGAVLLVVKEQIDLSTPAGRMMRTMMAGFAELERDTIVQRTVTGQRAKATSGEWPGGHPPYGWRLEGLKRDARVVADEAERQVIVTAYDLLVRRRWSVGQIADHLNDIGAKPRKANRWGYHLVRYLFRNPTIYTGVVTWGSADGRTNGKGVHHTRVDRQGLPLYGPPIEVTIGDPPLTKAQWDAAHRALARFANSGDNAPGVTQMLASRLYGECGKHLNGATLKGRPPVYRCAGRRHFGRSAEEKCACPQVQAHVVDEPVWAEIVALLGAPDRLQAMARQWLEIPTDADPHDEAPLAAGIDRQIGKLQRALERAKDDYYEADNPAEHRARIDRYRAELDDLRQRRAGYALLKAEAAGRAERLTDLSRLAERATGRLRGMAPAQRREVIELLDIHVQMGPVVGGRPASLQIRGLIDPRLFAQPEQTVDGGPSPRRSTAGSSSAPCSPRAPGR